MNVDDLLSLERRTGVKDVDIEDFLRKATEIEAAVSGLKDGTVDPTKEIKIDGIETLEEKAERERQAEIRKEESLRKQAELKARKKKQEREKWWQGSELFAEKASDSNKTNADDVTDTSSRAAFEREKVLQRYSFDYSRWNDWDLTDEASLEEKKRLDDEAEEARNKEFEKNNPEFCNNFLDDIEKRNKALSKKKESAEEYRNKGNRYFKKQRFDLALEQYMESLKLLPFEVKTLTNIAQVYIKTKEYEDAHEFLKRTLYLDPKHVKALSRKAFVDGEEGNVDEAIAGVKEAIKYAPENEDLKVQLRDLEIIANELEKEKRLKEALPTPPPAVSEAVATDKKSTNENEKSVDNTSTPVGALPPVPGPTTTKKKVSMNDFEFADQVTTVVSEISTLISGTPSDPVDLSIVPRSGNDDIAAHVDMIRDLTKRVVKNEMLKTYMRTSGLLAKIVTAVREYGIKNSTTDTNDSESAVSTVDFDDKQSLPVVITAFLNLIADSIEGERSAKLLLLENKSLSTIRDLLGRVDVPELVVATTRVLLVCCHDHTCVKTRAFVFSDAKTIGLLAVAIGEITARMGKRLEGKTSMDGPSLQTFLKVASDLVKTISFSAEGKESMTTSAAEAATLVCAMSSALYECMMFGVRNEMAAFFDTGLDGKTPDFDSFMSSLQGAENSASLAIASETSLMIVEALLGCSMIEPYRQYFAFQIPRPSMLDLDVSTEMNKEEAQISCAAVLLMAVRSFPECAVSGLAVLMNASLVSDESVRKAIAEADGLNETLQGLDEYQPTGKKSLGDKLLACRRLGLLSRIAPLSDVQKVLYSKQQYRSILRAIKHTCTSWNLSSEEDVEYMAEALGHLIRTLGAVNNPSAECLKMAKEEGLVESLLAIFPVPKRELGEITPQSVTLTPQHIAPALLLGNAARCLIPLADDAEHNAPIMFQNRSLIGVEKLTCAMATCSDIRVRKNMSILLAKGCRLTGVKELVVKYRGLEMMRELQSSFGV